MSLKKRQITDRLVRASYMGFLLDDDCNDFLGSKMALTDVEVLKFIDNYNKNINNNQYKIRLTLNKYGLQVRTLGEFIHYSNEELIETLTYIQDIINHNIESVISNEKKHVDVFDLELLLPLQLHGVTSMGHTYKAFNNKKYILQFLHLYSIIESY